MGNGSSVVSEQQRGLNSQSSYYIQFNLKLKPFGFGSLGKTQFRFFFSLLFGLKTTASVCSPQNETRKMKTNQTVFLNTPDNQTFAPSENGLVKYLGLYLSVKLCGNY